MKKGSTAESSQSLTYLPYTRWAAAQNHGYMNSEAYQCDLGQLFVGRQFVPNLGVQQDTH